MNPAQPGNIERFNCPLATSSIGILSWDQDSLRTHGLDCCEEEEEEKQRAWLVHTVAHRASQGAL